jgi:hypothetical protein
MKCARQLRNVAAAAARSVFLFPTVCTHYCSPMMIDVRCDAHNNDNEHTQY